MTQGVATNIDLPPTTARKVPTRWWQWWPLLLGPAGMVYVLLATTLRIEVLVAKRPHEILALVLTGLAALIGVVRAARSRHPYAIILSAVAVVVLMREIHWEWMTGGVYIALGLIAVWGGLWVKRLGPYCDAHPWVRVWLISTAATYFLSLFLARCALSYIFTEGTAAHAFVEERQTEFEEVAENMAHLMLLVTVCLGSYRRTSDTP